jgi:hypothetical protein
MKTAIFASVICLAVGEMGLTFEVIEARQPQDLWPAGRGDEQAAVAAPNANSATARGPEDGSSPKPTDIIIETEHHYGCSRRLANDG